VKNTLLTSIVTRQNLNQPKKGENKMTNQKTKPIEMKWYWKLFFKLTIIGTRLQGDSLILYLLIDGEKLK